MYTVYISHSVRPWELAQVYVMAQEAQRQGLESFIPDRAWPPGGPFPAYIVDALQQCQVVLLFATAGGHNQEWVNQELSLGGQKQIVALVEQGIQLQGLSPQSVIQFDRSQSMVDVVQATAARLASLQVQRRNSNLITGLVIASLVLLLLRGVQGDEGQE